MNRSVRTSIPLVLVLLGSLGGSLAACDGDEDGAGGAGGTGEGGAGGAGGSTSTGTSELPNRFFLRLQDGPPPPIVLELDKEKALEVFGEEAARQITLLEVDSTPLLINVLEQIQNACGEEWRTFDPPPIPGLGMEPPPPSPSDVYGDCTDTDLGQSFGPNWQTSPQFALVRLLSMTPATAQTKGTPMEGMAQYVEQNYGLLFSKRFGEFLGEILNDDEYPAANTLVPPYRPLIPINVIAQGVQEQLLATHPAIANPEGRIAISIYDALNDMTPLAQKLGPVGLPPWNGPGEHPGVLLADDDSFTTKSDALLDNFLMRVVANSNLRWVSGVDLSSGAGDMFLSEAGAALEFDFNDPERLQLEGIADAPTLDMRLAMYESPEMVPSCEISETCKSNYPGSPVGTGTVWTLKPWLLEPIVARSAMIQWSALANHNRCWSYFGQNCVLGAFVGTDGAPPGWARFVNDVTPLFDVPNEQFLWELVANVAQVAIHDPTGEGTPDIAEGTANPTFALHGVPIGLTREELIAQMRPTLQSQSDYIAEVILGRYWVNNDGLDFYYRRPTPGGQPYLYFVAESDLRPSDSNPGEIRPYTYERPGFFSSPDLSEASKVSSTTVDGVEDTEHEKFLLPQGQTVLYMQDDEGARYEVRFYVPEADSVEITAEVNRL